MRKQFRKTVCVVLSAAMVFTSGNFSDVKINLPWDFSAVANAIRVFPVDETPEVTSSIVKDTVLLNALKEIIGGGNNITLKQLKEFTGTIDLSGYTSITSIEGLGYARSATVIDMSKLTKVTTIPKEEFYSCSMTKVMLPESIKTIESYAFSGCSNMTYINIPDSVVRIYDNAFDGCTKLVDVNATGGLVLPANLVKLGNNAFANCSSIKSVVLPDKLSTTLNAVDDTVDGMGSGCFANCTKLESVTFGAAMTMVPASTFQGTSNLTEIEIPARFTEIGESAFAKSALYYLDLSKCTKMTTIGNQAFMNSYLYGIVLPDSLTKINDYVFANSAIASVEVTNKSNITEVGIYAFQGASNLKDATFFANMTKLTSIGYGAFYNSSIESTNKDVYGDKIWYGGPVEVVLPGSVKTIGEKAFYNCRDLESVEIKDMGQVTGSTIRSIGKQAFYYDWHLTSVILPEDNNANTNMEVQIEDQAFEQCWRLEDINFPVALTKIGYRAFYNCAFAKKRTVYGNKYYVDSSKYTKDDVFTTTGTGTKITFCIKDADHKYSYLQEGYLNIPSTDLHPDSAKPANYFEVYIYYADDVEVGHADTTSRQDIAGLKNIDLSRNTRLVDIGTNAFERCYSLESVVLPDNLVDIPAAMFKECGTSRINYTGNSTGYVYNKWFGLNSVEVSDNLKTIGKEAFASDYNLELSKNYLPETVESIGEKAFYYNCNIGELAMPKSLTYIGSSAFAYCQQKEHNTVTKTYTLLPDKGLTYVDFEKALNINYIGDSAFRNTTITKFEIPASAPLKAVRSSTCYMCYQLKTVVTSDNVENIMDKAFGACIGLNSINAATTTVLAANMVLSGSINDGITSLFTLTLRKPTDTITFRENESDPIDIYSVLDAEATNVGGYDGIYSTVKIDDVTFAWDTDNKQLTANGSTSSLDLLPFVETNEVKTTETGTKYNVSNLYFTGIREADDIAVDINMSFNFPVLGTSMLPVQTSVKYNAKVRKVPCEKIECDDVYVGVEATTLAKAVTVTPDFYPATTTDEVTWQIVNSSADDKVTMVVSEDGKSAQFYTNDNGYGSTQVKIKAGSVTKDIYVHVCAPANSITIEPTSMNIGFNSVEKLVATIKYDSKYADYYDAFPDKVVFTSSDESVVSVGDIVTTIGESRDKGNTATVELIANKMGSATITATLASSNGKTKRECPVTVVANDLSMYLTAVSDETEFRDGDSISLYRTNAVDSEHVLLDTKEKWFKYQFTTDAVASNDIEYIIDDENIAKVENLNTKNKQFKISAKGAGTTDITIYPKGFDPAMNGITITVNTTADVNGISLRNKTVLSGEPDSIIDRITNTYGERIENGDGIAALTENTLTFTSSDESIATVDNKGVVTVKRPGAIVITCEATASDGTFIKSATCNVTCKISASDLKVSAVSDKTYTGSNIEPVVTVKDGNNKLTKDVNYSVSYSDNRKVGTATIKIKCKGDYDGETFVTFVINPGVVSNLAQSSGKTTKAAITWEKRDEATGYEIAKVSGSTYTKVTTTKNIKMNFTKLKKNSTYTYAVRTYTKADDGKIYYGNYRKVKVLTATAAPKIKKAKAGKKKATVTWKKVAGADGYIIYKSTKKKKGYKKAVVVKGGKKTKAVVKKLKSRKKYFFKVKAYRLSGKKKILSGFSKVKQAKAK